MPYGDNDWLALTQEPTLEPGLPICDPHHHFWDFRTVRIPYQRYLLHELAADVNSGHNIRSTVFIETRSMYRTDGPEEFRPVGEVEFFQGLENTRLRQRVRIRLEMVYQLVHVFAVVRKYIEVCIGFIPSDGPSCRMSCIIA